MSKKVLPIFVAIVIIVGGGAFFGGMKYQQGKASTSGLSQNFQNARQQFQANGSSTLGNGSRFAGGGVVAGKVISKDAQSLTLQTQNGGSVIVFYSASTTVSKTTQGTMSDIQTGQQVTAVGTQNSDGSYTARDIQEGTGAISISRQGG